MLKMIKDKVELIIYHKIKAAIILYRLINRLLDNVNKI